MASLLFVRRSSMIWQLWYSSASKRFKHLSINLSPDDSELSRYREWCACRTDQSNRALLKVVESYTCPVREVLAAATRVSLLVGAIIVRS